MSHHKKVNELRITGVTDTTSKLLVNISKNLGVSKSDMLKPVITKWANEQPENLKREYKENF